MGEGCYVVGWKCCLVVWLSMCVRYLFLLGFVWMFVDRWLLDYIVVVILFLVDILLMMEVLSVKVWGLGCLVCFGVCEGLNCLVCLSSLC